MAKLFDNFIYGLMLANMEALPSFKYAKKQLCDIATALERKVSIPQIKAKLPLIQTINTDEFWNANDALQFEIVRKELRELIKFLNDGTESKPPIYTNLIDPVLSVQEGVELEAAYDFEDYRMKVNRYVNENGNAIAIHKLTHNIPLTVLDYEQLERVLTVKLGSKADYEREFGETPFGLLIRRIAKLDHDATMAAFSEFINDQSLNQQQIAFVHKVIKHVEQNGYMEDMSELLKPPFDKPLSFMKLFDVHRQKAIMLTLTQIKNNAIHVVA